MGFRGQTTLTVVDDLSVDNTVELIRSLSPNYPDISIEIIQCPTNFGNQGAIFYGLQRLIFNADDILCTFDCDGEDDVRELPSIINMGAENPGKVVLIERNKRTEGLVFKICLGTYKVLFRFLTGNKIIPNNFMLIPAQFIPALQHFPLAAAHFAYSVLRLRLPFVSTGRDRRQRYGGNSSQNLLCLLVTA
jgi:polyisoprenyl-phosphate glycosyltransferase